MDAKTLCLGILYRCDASGYEIKKQCEDGPFGEFYAAGFGSIYPALTALGNAGQVRFREMQQDKRPDKKVYSITASGRAALLDALMSDPGPDKIRSPFAFTAFFGELLPARRLDEMFEQRLGWLRERIAEMEDGDRASESRGAAFTLGLGRAIYQAQIDYIEDERHALVAASLNAETPPTVRETQAADGPRAGSAAGD